MEEKRTTDIDIAYPGVEDLHAKISVGTCRLNISPGGGDAWVSGTYTDPSGALPPKITGEGGVVRVSHEPQWGQIFGLLGNAPRFDLALGKAKPYMLTVESGASDNIIDLGGLPITRFQLRQGAGKVRLDFSEPNPQEMSLLTINGGAGSVEIARIANAHFVEVNIEGGAASYKLDFGGTLQRNGHVRISTAMSSVELTIPGSTAVKVTSETPLGSLDIGDGFTTKEGAFWTAAALAGGTPVMTVHASVTLGSLRLRTM